MPSMNLQFSYPEAEIPPSSYAANVTGFSPYARFKEPVFRPGSLAIAPDGTIWEFGKATAAIAVAAPTVPVNAGVMAPWTPPTPVACAFNATTGAISAGAGHTTFAAFAVDEHGWVKRDGTGI